MKNLSGILILLSIVSCGKKGVLNDVYENLSPHDNLSDEIVIQKDFVKYVEMFEAEFNESVNISIEFDNLEDNLAGVCYKYSNGRRTIRIDKKFWSAASEERREVLMYHEMGHCILDLKHNDEYFYNKTYACPESIMNSFIFSDNTIKNCYNPLRSDYIDEVFKSIDL